jgi:EmrB/QacA subfamily drug resistance transporter
VTAQALALPARSGEHYGVRPGYLLITVSLGALLAPLNSTMLAVALPVIRKDLAISHEAAGWLISSYLIAMAVTQPAAGRLGDRIGRATVFRAGLLAFLVFSLGATAAPNFGVLLVFRTLQAIAGAILIPNAMGMLRESVPASEFGRFSGWNSAIIGATAAVGPLLGGLVLSLVAWRYIFLLNVPVVAVALVMTARLQSEPAVKSAGGRLDWAGVLLFSGLLCLTTVVLNTAGPGQILEQLLLGAALAALIGGFAWRQAHTSSPMAEWRLFRGRSFLGASGHILLMNLAMYTTLLAIPFFLSEVQHRGSAVAGILLGGMAGLQALTGPAAGRIADRVGRRLPTLASSVIAFAAALLLLFGIGRDVSPVYLGVALAILGLGVGTGFVSATVAAIEAAPKSLAGSAAGTQSMMRYFGSIIGVGVLSGLLTTGTDGPPGIGVFRMLFGLVAVLLALSAVAASLVHAAPREE